MQKFTLSARQRKEKQHYSLHCLIRVNEACRKSLTKSKCINRARLAEALLRTEEDKETWHVHRSTVDRKRNALLQLCHSKSSETESKLFLFRNAVITVKLNFCLMEENMSQDKQNHCFLSTDTTKPTSSGFLQLQTTSRFGNSNLCKNMSPSR